MLMGGMIVDMLVTEDFLNETYGLEVRLWAWKYYGYSVKANYSLFEVTLTGNWLIVARH